MNNKFLIYIMVGLIYWSINIFIRKLHTKNEPEDGWILSILWIFGWPVCFITLIIYWFGMLKLNKKL